MLLLQVHRAKDILEYEQEGSRPHSESNTDSKDIENGFYFYKLHCAKCQIQSELDSSLEYTT